MVRTPVRILPSATDIHDQRAVFRLHLLRAGGYADQPLRWEWNGGGYGSTTDVGCFALWGRIRRSAHTIDARPQNDSVKDRMMIILGIHKNHGKGT